MVTSIVDASIPVNNFENIYYFKNIYKLSVAENKLPVCFFLVINIVCVD